MRPLLSQTSVSGRVALNSPKHKNSMKNLLDSKLRGVVGFGGCLQTRPENTRMNSRGDDGSPSPPPLRSCPLRPRRWQYLDEDETNVQTRDIPLELCCRTTAPWAVSPPQQLTTLEILAEEFAPAHPAIAVRPSKPSFWSLPAAPSAIPVLQVLLQWLIRLGEKKEVRNPPASARHTSVELSAARGGRSKVRAARDCCCLKTRCVSCRTAANSDLTSAPTGCVF